VIVIDNVDTTRLLSTRYVTKRVPTLLQRSSVLAETDSSLNEKFPAEALECNDANAAAYTLCILRVMERDSREYYKASPTSHAVCFTRDGCNAISAASELFYQQYY
jgi:hypothetical protein